MDTETDLAWLAGFLDGEGCLYCQPRKGNREGNTRVSLRLVISNTERKLLDACREISGVGRVYEKSPDGYRNRQRQWAWDVSSGEVGHVLAGMLPYLKGRRRREEAIGLKFRRLPRGGSAKRASVWLKLAQLAVWRALREEKPKHASLV